MQRRGGARGSEVLPYLLRRVSWQCGLGFIAPAPAPTLCVDGLRENYEIELIRIWR
jgi:hypothetical protein